MARAPTVYTLPATEGHSVSPATRELALALCRRESAATIRAVLRRGDEIKTARERGREAGSNAAKQHESTIRRILGLDTSPPAGRAALLAGVGGSVFAEAARIPRDVADQGVTVRRAEIAAQLAELTNEENKLTEELAPKYEELALLCVARDAWPILVGLLAAIPYVEMAQAGA